jgi:hypothetical protein
MLCMLRAGAPGQAAQPTSALQYKAAVKPGSGPARLTAEPASAGHLHRPSAAHLMLLLSIIPGPLSQPGQQL